MHIIVSTGSLIISLSSADFTQANVQDNQIYPATITSSLLHGVRYMAAADSGYDDHKLYDWSIHRRRGFELVCPVSEIYNSNTSSDILQLIEFYESELGQVIYSWRGISVEPLIEHIKYVFKIDPLITRGVRKQQELVLVSVLLYQIIVYHNCVRLLKNIRKQSNTC